MRNTLIVLATALCLVALPGLPARASDDSDKADKKIDKKIEDLQEQIDDLDARLMPAERHAGTDRMEFSGDYRFEAHSYTLDIPDRFDGMALQGLMVDTLFYANENEGMMPVPGAGQTVRDVLDAYINGDENTWVRYQQYLQGLTFDGLKQAVGSFPPAMQQQLFGLLLPETFRPADSIDNSILYTNRLRLRFKAKVARNVTFDGRLAMYKVWGDSTGVQVFNGQPNSINFDGTTATVPNSDILRVERAFFNWTNIAGTPLYISIGRRPSTEGAPLNFRQDEMRGGTPLGTAVDFQFDGLTVGYHVTPKSTARLCYGVGYESGFGNGLDAAADLKDAQFLGVNWDIWDTDKMFIQTTVLRAFDVTDGFNGLVVMPVDPLTGKPAPGPAVMRFTPSQNLGDFDLGSVLLIRRDGPVDWFASASYSKSHPNSITTPFGGLLADPFDVPEDHSGSMFWAGVRYNFNEDRTKLGLEFNHGSQYWFNFAMAQDDLIAPKTSTRGDVWELYLTHRIYDRFIVKLDYIDYDFDYSGSGWILGDPKDLKGDTPPILGFPAYESAKKFAFSMIARW